MGDEKMRLLLLDTNLPEYEEPEPFSFASSYKE